MLPLTPRTIRLPERISSIRFGLSVAYTDPADSRACCLSAFPPEQKKADHKDHTHTYHELGGRKDILLAPDLYREIGSAIGGLRIHIRTPVTIRHRSARTMDLNAATTSWIRSLITR